MTQNKPFSKACENNKAPILEQLANIFVGPGTVLEIGSGTGQHAVYFARHLPHLIWQPSDHPQNHRLCLPWLNEARLANLRQPLPLDVQALPWPVPAADGLFSANTAHIMPWPAVESMFKGAGELLQSDAPFCLYGPFSYCGRHTSASNEQFDRHLKSQNPAMGIRDMTDLERVAHQNGLVLIADHDLPANNRLTVWQRRQASRTVGTRSVPGIS